MSRFLKRTSPISRTIRTWRDYVTLALVFGCVPGLALSIICWLLALLLFAQAGALLAMLITALLAVISIVLIMTLVDEVGMQFRMYVNDPTHIGSQNRLWVVIWSIIICLGLLLSDARCLFQATRLEDWHYVLAGSEVLLVCIQTWRVLRRRSYTYF